jgi:hypothetical protein
MKYVKHNLIWICCAAIFFSSIAWAVKPSLGEILPGDSPLISVTNHTPEAFKNSNEYWDSLQMVQLEIGKQDRFRDLPKLGMKNPFTGEITLGDKPEKFGVIVDIVGDEKRLYIDTNGDGSFADESWSPLLNEWHGLQIYWVEGPEPIRLQVGYSSKPNQKYPIEIMVAGVLNRPGAFVKEKPYLKVAVRTWFLAKLTEDGSEKLAAIVDRNNNGRFNDPEDQLFIDYNDDDFFSENESISRKQGITIQSGKRKLAVDWGSYPEKLRIGGKISE